MPKPTTKVIKATESWLSLPIQHLQSRCIARDTTFPRLKHGLDRVLFSPGVHYATCPRTRHANFPSMPRIPRVEEFDFDALPEFTPPSKDGRLIQLAQEKGARYVGSTSSLTNALSHCYFLLSHLGPLNMSNLSMAYVKEPITFAKYLFRPTTIRLKRQAGNIFAVNYDDAFEAEDTVLMMLGHVMERMLTMEGAQFQHLLHHRPEGVSPPHEVNAYHFAEVDTFLVRSQIDCHHPELPNMTFDLKTRATIATRLDIHNYLLHQGYEIRHLHGILESFEREFYDMMRTTLLKYNFQVRLGHMDGIFVAYHNTKSIFGYQYLPKQDMDARLFGSTEMGDAMFLASMRLLREILDEATRDLPNDYDVRITLQYTDTKKLRVYLEPLPSKEMERKGVSVSDATHQTNNVESASSSSSLPDPGMSTRLRKIELESKARVNNKPLRSKKQTPLMSLEDISFKYKLHHVKTKKKLPEEYEKVRTSMEKWAGPQEPRRDSGLVAILRRISAGSLE